MRKLLALLSALASPALAQTSAGVINAPIYATGYISQVGGTNITTKIAAQPNHPTNLNIYTTSAITGIWTIQLPNPAFEGQVLSFNCGEAAAIISVTSSDGSSIDSKIPTTCPATSGFSLQFDQRNNIWRVLASNSSIIASGSPPTLASSCTVGSQVGGNAAGSFVLGSSCSSIVNFTFNMTAPHDWFCAATNATTGMPLGHSNTGASTTMANIQVYGSNGDLIRFACTPF